MTLKKGWLAAMWAGVGCLILVISLMSALLRSGDDAGNHRYQDLPAAPQEDALAGMEPDFTLTDRFTTNLPLVVLELDGDLPD